MSNANDLKPCPFCGGEAEYEESENNGVDELITYCTDCKANFNIKWHWDNRLFTDDVEGSKAKDKARLISLWNTRTPAIKPNNEMDG